MISTSETPKRKKVTRVRIVHPHDAYKGQIGYIVEVIDQHSLYTYVVVFRGSSGSWVFTTERRAYQRNEIKFLKTVNTPKWLK